MSQFRFLQKGKMELFFSIYFKYLFNLKIFLLIILTSYILSRSFSLLITWHIFMSITTVNFMFYIHGIMIMSINTCQIIFWLHKGISRMPIGRRGKRCCQTTAGKPHWLCQVYFSWWKKGAKTPESSSNKP